MVVVVVVLVAVALAVVVVVVVVGGGGAFPGTGRSLRVAGLVGAGAPPRRDGCCSPETDNRHPGIQQVPSPPLSTPRDKKYAMASTPHTWILVCSLRPPSLASGG